MCFFLYLVTEIAFSHSFIGRAGLILFFIATCLLCILRMKITGSYYFIISALFILYNWINVRAGVSIVPQASLDMIQTMCINVIVLFAFYNYVVLRNDMEKVLKIFVYATLFVTSVVFIVSLPTIFNERFGSFVDMNPNSLAVFTSIALLITLCLLLGRKMHRNGYLFLLWLLFVTILTGSRKGILIVSLGTAVLLYFLYPQKKLKNALIVSMGIAVMYLIIMNTPLLYDLLGYRVQAMVNYTQEGPAGIDEASLKSRYNYIEKGWQNIKLKPWFGYGLDSFRHFIARTYSHNNFIEILISGGIIGFILYYLNYLVTFIKYQSLIKNGSVILKLMLTITLVMLVMDYSMVTYYSRINLSIFVLAIACASTVNKNTIGTELQQ